jgi:DNA-binding SARP family transcriptional activator
VLRRLSLPARHLYPWSSYGFVLACVAGGVRHDSWQSRRSQDSSEAEIQLFSDFRLAYGDTLVNITSARLQSLLAYLLLHRDTIQYRQHLAFLFWPDSTETQARTNLRYLLHQLRATLPNMDCFIDVQTQTLRWRPDTSFTLDVAEFERAAQTVTQVEQSGNQLVLQILEQAVGLYQGDLIPACYDDWITPKRERLCSQFLRLLAQLIALLEDQRDYCSAISYAQRLLLHNPLHEETYLRLLRLHALAGDRARGLRVYHTCVTTLQNELGVEPMPAIRKAYERLLKMEMAPESGQPVSATLTTPPPLVGRQPEWTQLLTIWSNTSQGVPHFVLIAGEAGVGKSRLAEELLTWPRSRGLPQRHLAVMPPKAVWLMLLSEIGCVDRELGQLFTS